MESIRSDNGPEFIAYAIQDWQEKAAIKTIYITPGSPWENGHIESFHDKLRHECLNRELFGSLLEARVILESWRVEYNDLRPHSSLGYMNPSEYMQKNQSDGGYAPPSPAPLAAAGVQGQLGANAAWRQKTTNEKSRRASVLNCPTRGGRSCSRYSGLTLNPSPEEIDSEIHSP